MTTPTNPNADHENARLARAHCARCYKTLDSLNDALAGLGIHTTSPPKPGMPVGDYQRRLREHEERVFRTAIAFNLAGDELAVCLAGLTKRTEERLEQRESMDRSERKAS